MGILIIEGFEGGLNTNAATGWSGNTPPFSAFGAPRLGPSGVGGQRSATLTASGLNYVAFRAFSWNQGQGRPVRVVEAYVACANFMSNVLLPGQIGLSSGSTAQIAAQVGSAASQAVRGLTTLVGVAGGGHGAVNATWGVWRSRMLIANANGICQIRLNADTVNAVDFSGDTQDTGVNYADNIYLRGGSASALNLSYDDIIVQAPSILVTGASGSPAAGTTLTGGISGATAIVSDWDSIRNVLWVYSWNGIPFQNGETISGGGFSATVSAPNGSFVNGFEPNSFWPDIVGWYVQTYRPTANGATIQLTPTGSLTNVLNINDNPTNVTDFNSALSGAAETDRYGTFGSVSAGVTQIRAVQPTPLVELGGAYLTFTAGLTDTTGTQTFLQSLPATLSARGQAFNYRADRTAWTTSDVPAFVASMTFSP